MKKILLGICLLVTTNLVFSQLTPDQEKLYKEILAVRAKKVNAVIHENHLALDLYYDSNAIVIKEPLNLKLNHKDNKKTFAQNKVEYDTIIDLKITPQFFNDNRICILSGVANVLFIKPVKQAVITDFTEIYYLNNDHHWKIIYFHSQKPK